MSRYERGCEFTPQRVADLALEGRNQRISNTRQTSAGRESTGLDLRRAVAEGEAVDLLDDLAQRLHVVRHLEAKVGGRHLRGGQRRAAEDTAREGGRWGAAPRTGSTRRLKPACAT